MGMTTTVTVERDRSIDVLRGLLVVLLVIVEYLPPRPELAWLQHSPWDGVRVADFVFPGYLFVVGATMAVARRASWPRLLRRTISLLALGLLFNAATEHDPLRFTGVLQTIAVAGFLAAVAVRFVRRSDDVALVAGLLLLGHALVLDRAFEIDRAVFPDARLYREGALGHDPEGVLATVLGATALVLLGWVVARTRSWWTVLGLGVATAVACAGWAPNKRAWTPSFTVLMAVTFAVLLLA